MAHWPALAILAGVLPIPARGLSATGGLEVQFGVASSRVGGPIAGASASFARVFGLRTRADGPVSPASGLDTGVNEGEARVIRAITRVNGAITGSDDPADRLTTAPAALSSPLASVLTPAFALIRRLVRGTGGGGTRHQGSGTRGEGSGTWHQASGTRGEAGAFSSPVSNGGGGRVFEVGGGLWSGVGVPIEASARPPDPLRPSLRWATSPAGSGGGKERNGGGTCDLTSRWLELSPRRRRPWPGSRSA